MRLNFVLVLCLMLGGCCYLGQTLIEGDNISILKKSGDTAIIKRRTACTWFKPCPEGFFDNSIGD